jgi:hypothetical protein
MVAAITCDLVTVNFTSVCEGRPSLSINFVTVSTSVELTYS